MNINETTKPGKNSFTFASIGLAGVALFMGLLVTLIPSHRQYFPASVSDTDNDMGAKGMEEFFFNARKNITTNAMDYPSMLAASIADRAMTNTRRTHAATVVPTFNWITMGPTNIGGRTRAILIDNKDISRQTVFAGGITGGIWKSTNGGATWDNAENALAYSLNDTMQNLNICCLAQDANGILYAGTGEGFTAGQASEFSSGELGGGIFKSTDDGNIWTLLPSTAPSPLNSNNVKFSYTNRIAIRPDAPETLYAATITGMLISRDGGTTWRGAYKSTGTALSGSSGFNSLDAKISTDGSVIVACIGSYGYYCYPQINDSVFTLIKNTGAGKLNGPASRIEFAISPTDANRIYASVIQNNTLFGTGGTNSGIFMTMTAKSSGGYWYDIGPGGSTGFDPYTEPGPTTYDQATYDNTVGVPPANEAQVLVGGTTVWEWSGSSITDTLGTWAKVSHYGSDYNGDPLGMHPDQHAIVFDNNNPETVYFGNDGGIYKCSNFYLNPALINLNSNTVGSIASLVIQPFNRNYNVTQYYTVCFSPEVDTASVPISINNGTSVGTITENLGVGGGTQDNGSPYINGGSANYPNDGADLSGGDGAGAVVSTLAPNIAYFCSDYGFLLREGNLGNLSAPTVAYTETKGYDLGGNIDSVWNGGTTNSCFVFPVALYENPYDTLNHDSLLYIAPANDSAGETIWLISQNGETSYPYVLPKALAAGDTMTVPDRVVSRLAIGFAGSKGGIWINGQGASNNTVVWMPIAGTLSKPTAYSDGSTVHALAWTPDGDCLFAGCEDGAIFRFTNINSIIANNYRSGALWSNGGSRGIVDTTNNVVSTNMNFTGGARDILSISVDQNNGNNVLVTVGNYGQSTYVYYCNNALGATPTFSSAQGNLPAMPVYSSILDIMDSSGHWIPNSAMIGTEHGIYTTTNITAASVKWVKNSSGLANVMTLALKQQTAPNWRCNNSGTIYAGTHGRGIWSTGTFHVRGTAVQPVTASVAQNNLLVYPNPMSSEGNIKFNLSAENNVTIIIYDMQGHEVKTITMGTQSPGDHTVTFASSDLRAGTYFATISGTGFRKVSKFIVIK